MPTSFNISSETNVCSKNMHYCQMGLRIFHRDGFRAIVKIVDGPLYTSENI